MSVAIYCYAQEVAVPPYTSKPPKSSTPSRRVVIPCGTPRHSICGLIKKAKSKHEKITTLHLVAHGSPGVLYLSGGRYPGLAIDAGAASWFGALKGHFDPTFPLIVIHGCNSASNVGHNANNGLGWYGHNQAGAGYNFLLEMAKATQAMVQGAIHRQSNDRGYQMEGPTITVGPKGAVAGAEFAY